GIGALRGRGDVTVKPGSMPQLFIDDVESFAEHHLLVDARENSRFTGKKEQFDHQAGHIPGAVNIPVKEFQDANGTIAGPETVRDVLSRHGITDGRSVAVYSGSGLHSSLFLAVMEYAGIYGARNFIGGWSQWSAIPTKPIVRGE
ncbi:sulfurtransferase, partial [Corynebacterium heidelbergense]